MLYKFWYILFSDRAKVHNSRELHNTAAKNLPMTPNKKQNTDNKTRLLRGQYICGMVSLSSR